MEGFERELVQPHLGVKRKWVVGRWCRESSHKNHNESLDKETLLAHLISSIHNTNLTTLPITVSSIFMDSSGLTYIKVPGVFVVPRLSWLSLFHRVQHSCGTFPQRLIMNREHQEAIQPYEVSQRSPTCLLWDTFYQDWT